MFERSAPRGGLSRFLTLLVTAAVLLSGEAGAVTLNDVTIHGKLADTILEKNELSVAWAEKIAKHCVDEATSRNLPISVAVIDQAGVVIYYYRADGEPKSAVKSALFKAKTAWNLRAPSKSAQNAVLSGASSDARQVAAGNFPQAGGLPIVVDHQFLGAIGVGGTRSNPPDWSDEICGYRALTAVLGPQPPLLPDITHPQ